MLRWYINIHVSKHRHTDTHTYTHTKPLSVWSVGSSLRTELLSSANFQVIIKDNHRTQTAENLVSQALALTLKVTSVLSGEKVPDVTRQG